MMKRIVWMIAAICAPVLVHAVNVYSYYSMGDGSAQQDGTQQIISPSWKTVNSGGSVTFTATPPVGYEVTGWWQGTWPGGTSQWTTKLADSGTTYTWKYVSTSASGISVKVRFDPKTYSISSSAANGSVTVDSSASYTNTVTITWAPKAETAYEYYTLDSVNVYAGKSSSGTLLKTFTSGTSGTFNMSTDLDETFYDDIFVEVQYESVVKKYTITFDACGGTCSETTREVAYGAYIGDLPTATQERKTLDGWHEDPSVSSPVLANDTYLWTKDITLYAHWKDAVLYTIAAEVVPEAGGTVTGAGDEFELGDDVTLTANPNDGYSFVAWLNKDGTTNTTEATLSTKVAGNVTYTAAFTGNVYTVYFDPMKGTCTFEEGDYRYGEPWGTLPAVTPPEGMAFVGWYTKRTGGTKMGDTVDFTDFDEPTYYAHYEAKPSYTVAFEGNGATNETKMANQTMYCGEEATLSKNAYGKIGYAFAGWATNVTEAAGLNAEYEDGESVVDIALTNATATLYAVWETNEYSVVFDGNGAAGTMAKQQFVYDQPQALAANAFTTNALYSFAGWSNTVSGVIYQDGEKVTNLCEKDGEELVLTALWKSNLTDLSKAMHCDTMVWANGEYAGWTPCELDQETYGTDTAVSNLLMSTGPRWETGDMISTNALSERGVMSFAWRCDNADTELSVVIGDEVKTFTVASANVWTPVTVTITNTTKIVIRSSVPKTKASSAPTIYVDQMKWTPGGEEPTEKDRVEPSAIAAKDGKFSISFTGSTDYKYQLEATESLSPVDWQLIEEPIAGTGAAQAIEVPVDPAEHPQRFFRIRTLAK